MGATAAPVSGTSSPAADPGLRRLAGRLLDELGGRSPDPVLAAAEPSEWGQLCTLVTALSSTEVASTVVDLDRFLGAWQGRAAGCLLGKPVEKIPRAGIREILVSSGGWPLSGYFTAAGVPDDVRARWPWNRRSAPNSLRENVSGMPEDDDLNYPMIALTVLERAGRTATTADFAQAWLDLLPGGRVFTAERVAYRNLLDGLSPPDTAVVRNPYREWIGAAIRGDLLGWVSAGNPAAAAQLAFVDARLSHTRNGIYGEMFTAAMCSLALVADSVHDVVDGALAVIPPQSRLADAIRLGRDLGVAREFTVDAGIDRIAEAYGRLHWVHVLPNVSLSVFALTRSGGDFGPAICTAVSGGWDTDSNGATVGSICGALAGASRLPPEWIGPLDNRIASSIPGFDGVAITALAERTAALARSVTTQRDRPDARSPVVGGSAR